MNYFLKNKDILSKKFPYLYLLLLSKNDFCEKKLSLNEREDIDFSKFKNKLIIYKCAFGNNFSNILNWLKNKDSKLYIIEDDLDCLICFFHTKEAFYLLKEDIVYFYFFNNIKKIAKEITKDSISKDISVISFIKNKKIETLRKEIIHANLLSAFQNEDSLYSFKIFKNFYLNFEKLKTSFLINKLKNKLKNTPAIVVGAGPSLKYSFEKLKTYQNKALIIAGGSAITILSKEGILPHLGVIVDPNFEEFKRMKESDAFEIPIIYSTRVNNGVFSTFNGPKGYIKAAIGGFFELWLDTELKMKDKYIFYKNDEKSLTVTTICIKIAKLLGCNPIILDGIDLAYSDERRYALDIIPNNSQIEEDFIYLSDKNGNKVKSNLTWEIERSWFSNFAKSNRSKTFLNATKNGLKIDNILDMAFEEIEKRYFSSEVDLKSYIHSLIFQDCIIDELTSMDSKNLQEKLKKSFLNTKSYLADIVKNEAEYKVILAKENLKDEIAYKFFLLTLELTLRDFYNNLTNDSYKKLKKSASFFLKQMKV